MSRPSILLIWMLAAGCTDSHPAGEGTVGSSESRPAEASAAPPGPADFGAFRFQPPAEWKTVLPPGSPGMRKAQYALPPPPTGGEEGELVVYFFGVGSGGTVEANLERWRGQFTPPAGKTREETASVSRKTVDGLPITILEVSGSYQGMDPSGGPAPAAMPAARMLAAVIETPRGSYYIRTVGADATILHWREPWQRMLDEMKAGLPMEMERGTPQRGG